MKNKEYKKIMEAILKVETDNKTTFSNQLCMLDPNIHYLPEEQCFVSYVKLLPGLGIGMGVTPFEPRYVNRKAVRFFSVRNNLSPECSYKWQFKSVGNDRWIDVSINHTGMRKFIELAEAGLENE